MSGDERDRPRRRARAIARPQVPPGPLRELKDLLYELYLSAGTPTLDEMTRLVADADLPGLPERDTVNRCIGAADLPANLLDVVAIGAVLARRAAWDEGEVEERLRRSWTSARMASPFGRSIRELRDPFELEVHPSIELEEAGELPILPEYVVREHDDAVRSAVLRSLSGQSTVAVLIGGSSTGKTRACWEALQRIPDDWRLWHPIDPGRPESALASLHQVGPRTVVWLNEAQHYLLTPGSPLGEQVAAGLRELLRDPARAPVLVLGTLWPEYWDTLIRTPDPADDDLSFEDGRKRGKAKKNSDPHAQARVLLTGVGIPVPENFDLAALTALGVAARRDPRLALAWQQAEGGRVTQYLAGVPALMERYHNAPPAARAVIDAAIDARRLGHGIHLSHAYLASAAPAYLDDHQWDSLRDDWLSTALRYTSAPCRGSRGPLARVRPRPGYNAPDEPGYRLADYLEQVGRTRRRFPEKMLAALIEHAPREDLDHIAVEAQRVKAFMAAGLAYARLAESGAGDAFFLAADMMRRSGSDKPAIAWLRSRGERGDPRGFRGAADLSHRAGDIDAAITAYRKAAALGDAVSLRAAAELLWTSGRSDDAVAWLSEGGGIVAERVCGDLLRRAGRLAEAIECYRNAAESGDAFSLRVSSSLMRETGRADEALAWLGVLEAAGNPFAAQAASDVRAKTRR